MTAAQMANVVSKALKRDIICMEHDNIFKFFLSEKDKANHLNTPADPSFYPAATITAISPVSETNSVVIWTYSYKSSDDVSHLSTADNIEEALWMLSIKWFSGKFLAESFKEYKG